MTSVEPPAPPDPAKAGEPAPPAAGEPDTPRLTDEADRAAREGHSPAEIGKRIRDTVEREAERFAGEPDHEQPPEQGEPPAPAATDVGDERAHGLAALGLEAVTADALDGTDLGVCPFCDGYGAVDPDAILKALPAIVEKVAPFPQSPTYERCDECDGWGRVLTGARLESPGIQPCPKCDGNGYLDKRSTNAATPPPSPSPEQPAPPPPPPGPDPLRTPPPEGRPPAVGMIWDQDAYTWTYPQP